MGDPEWTIGDRARGLKTGHLTCAVYPMKIGVAGVVGVILGPEPNLEMKMGDPTGQYSAAAKGGDLLAPTDRCSRRN